MAEVDLLAFRSASRVVVGVLSAGYYAAAPQAAVLVMMGLRDVEAEEAARIAERGSLEDRDFQLYAMQAEVSVEVGFEMESSCDENEAMHGRSIWVAAVRDATYVEEVVGRGLVEGSVRELVEGLSRAHVGAGEVLVVLVVEASGTSAGSGEDDELVPVERNHSYVEGPSLDAVM